MRYNSIVLWRSFLDRYALTADLVNKLSNGVNYRTARVKYGTALDHCVVHRVLAGLSIALRPHLIVFLNLDTGIQWNGIAV